MLPFFLDKFAAMTPNFKKTKNFLKFERLQTKNKGFTACLENVYNFP